MGGQISLKASDGHRLGGYRADPEVTPKGGVVVIQEIFGVNRSIRAACDRLARHGYSAVAPALFDRSEPGFESGYSPQEVAKARSFIARPDWDAMLRDANAAKEALAPSGPVGIIGFCLGGTIAYLAATRLSGLSAAVGYYGGQIVRFVEEPERCPVQLHFGEKDEHIPQSDVGVVRARHPKIEIYTYPAEHAFANEDRPSYHEPSARLAWERTLKFLDAHMRP
ncbi:MAG TPA: dienelactone hydrolase family protein [Pseudorhodoplanes sp.]|nr:dienelactone hydrolase family protein [Pseudorhodoplanes sp.]